MSGRKTAILIVALGLLASLAGGYTTMKIFRDRTQTYNEFVAERVRSALINRIQIVAGHLHAIAGYMSVDRLVSEKEFEDFTQQLGISPETRAVQFVRPVSGGELQDYLDRMNRLKQRGFSVNARGADASLQPLEGAGQHYIIEHVYPYKGNEAALGLDIASNSTTLQAIQSAISQRDIAASASFSLVQDRNRRAFSIFRAISDSTTRHPTRLVGIAAALIDAEVLLSGLAKGNVQVIRAHNSRDRSELIRPRDPQADTFPMTIEVPVADDLWTLELAVGQQASPALAGFIALGLGILITLLLLAAQQQSNLQSRFRSIGRQLYENQQTLEEREAAYRALFDNAASANVEIDLADNRILRYNEAFLRLVGGPDDDLTGRPIPDFVDPADCDELLRRITGSATPKNGSAVFECRISAGRAEPTWALVSVGSDGTRWHSRGSACIVMQDMSEKKSADRARDLLVRELAHRVRNTMQLVASLAQQTARSSTTIEEYKSNLLGRLRALNSAQDALFEANWGAVRLDQLTHRVLSPFIADDSTQRFTMDVSPIMLSAQKSQTIALALHELASNAARHGALARVGGKVELVISVDTGSTVSDSGECLRLTWRETVPGRCISRSMRRGFGTIMLEKLLVQQHGGSSSFDWSSGGMVYEAELPLSDATG